MRIASYICSSSASCSYVGFTAVIKLNLMVPCMWDRDPSLHQHSHARLRGT
jgi:hypothetical protein